MRVVGYVREGVQGGPPLDVQEQELRDAARWAEWELVRIIEDGGGRSRAGLASAICELRGGDADAICASHRRVLSASYRRLYKIVQEVMPVGRVMILDENFNSDQPGALRWIEARMPQDRRQMEPQYPEHLIERMRMDREAGLGWTEIAAGLNFDGVRKLNGSGWRPTDVQLLLKRAHAAGTESIRLSG